MYFFLNLIIIYFKNKTTKLDGFINVPLQKKKKKYDLLGFQACVEVDKQQITMEKNIRELKSNFLLVQIKNPYHT